MNNSKVEVLLQDHNRMKWIVASKRAIPQEFSSTHCILHEGFSDFRRFEAHKISRCKLIGNRFKPTHDPIT